MHVQTPIFQRVQHVEVAVAGRYMKRVLVYRTDGMYVNATCEGFLRVDKHRILTRIIWSTLTRARNIRNKRIHVHEGIHTHTHTTSARARGSKINTGQNNDNIQNLPSPPGPNS